MEPASLLIVPKIIHSDGKERQYDDLKYSKVRFIGSGNSKKVWEASLKDTGKDTGRLVAVIKIVLNKTFPTRETVERELRFRDILKDHPGFIKVEKAFLIKKKNVRKVVWIETLFHGDLTAMVSAFNDLECRSIILKIKEAIQFAHSKNIVIGDLKAENIMVSYDFYRRITVAITDMGGCYFEGEDPTKDFTLAYLAPERFVSKGAPLPRSSDIYSLALIIFFILKRGSGVQFPADTLNSIEDYLNNCRIFRASVPQGPYQKDLQKMLEIDPKKRAKLEEVLLEG